MRTCWGLTSGQAGMVAQVKALASALKLTPQMKVIALRKPFGHLPNVVYPPFRKAIVPHLMAPESDTLAPPYPDLVISCGRRAALVAMGLKMHAPKTKFIHIQDPQMPASYFDLVIAMEHDSITGPNVIKTRFALHAITPDVLREAKQKFELVFAAYKAPRIAVLLGGSTNKYTFSVSAMQQVISSLQHILNQTQGSLLITPSRRTGENNIRLLCETFAHDPRVYIYDFKSENPYLGILALADFIIVTNDSVNMMSEAQATGKPVYMLSLLGHTDTKPAAFARNLIKDGIARGLPGKLEIWDYPISNEMQLLTEKITQRF